jgi:hypothetical protein
MPASGRMPMRKTRIAESALCCLLALFTTACATRPIRITPDDPLFGTWINEEYDREGRSGSAKVTMLAEGRELDYNRIADAEPAYEGRFAIEAAWIDGDGYRWYKLKGETRLYHADSSPVPWFALFKVHPDGKTLESSSAQYGYPTTVAPVTSPNYGIMYRQR